MVQSDQLCQLAQIYDVTCRSLPSSMDGTYSISNFYKFGMPPLLSRFQNAHFKYIITKRKHATFDSCYHWQQTKIPNQETSRHICIS